MDILGQSSLLVAVTSFAFGFSILSRNVRNKLFLAFALVCTLVSAWALSFFLENLWGSGVFYRYHLFCNIWLAPAGLAFIHVMVRIQDRFSRRLLEASVVTAMLLSVALIFDLDEISWVKSVVYFSPGFIGIQTLQLMWIDRKLRRGLLRIPKVPTVGLGRRNLIYLGALIVLMTSVMDHVPWMGKVVPVLGNLALTAYLFFISQAISQQRLLNFGALVSRFFVLLAVALTLTILYSILVAWIKDSPGLFFLNSFIASFLIITLLDPIRRTVTYFTQRLLTKEHLGLQQTLRDAQRRLTGVVDPGSLFQAILTTVEQTLQPQRAAIFILRSDGTKYRRARRVGNEPPEGVDVREVLSNNPLLQYCERLHRKGEFPILLDQILDNEIDRSASRVQKESLSSLVQGLKALDCSLLIPLFESGQILGFVTLYAPSPPEAWGSNWGFLQVLYPYFEQAAATLRNMEVFVRQREKERLAAIGEMSAGLAHEIRNPLGAIKGAAQFLDPSGDRPESRFLKVIVEEVDRLNRVVTQFLDYAKPYAAEMRSIEVSSVVEKSVEFLRPSVPHGIDLEFTPSKDPALVLAMPEQIHQVIINLIQNSFKALEGRVSGPIVGRVRISVDVSGYRERREVTIQVEDNGNGIQREHLDKLFIPFFTTSPSGTGLGLSICQRIIEAHGGRIDVLSEKGRGSRFTVVIPAEVKVSG